MERKIIAFIPVRGGSKSIPLKNIKNLCGKPLVCWNIEALEKSSYVDQIVVATDSKEIKDIVESYGYSKVIVYDRSAENANDTASTESVILEFINSRDLNSNDLFMLVQATSPLTQTNHFDEAIEKYMSSSFDSLLSCVRNFRFFWNDDGESINYDYRNRPIRQNFNGNLMENGAFYISKVDNILNTKNRLSGKIGVYEMPSYTGLEIDEIDDWLLIENLMYKYVISSKRESISFKNIKALFSDVDGVLTDGSMYYSENGDELKKFNTRDGMAFQLLAEKGIKTGFVTSENTKLVEKRANKLKINYLVQGKGFGGKLEAVRNICKSEGLKLSEIAYVGDDINCIELLNNVGFSFCPIDACLEVKKICGIHVINRKGGDSIIREIYNLILCNS